MNAEVYASHAPKSWVGVQIAVIFSGRSMALPPVGESAGKVRDST